jgi:hypothetical protein
MSVADSSVVVLLLTRLVDVHRFIFKVPVVACSIWSEAAALGDACKRTMMNWVEH